ncbi:hypothetical protein A8F94_00030 [Bacillus sp. FJAT-27225]|uniref:hypothetical protein n=1 Tax=Bacillus sp. FJAT-27225 TaxID=1743144 RepID=UPI00080C27ED|nr:hypothetical protein [Bacillus sp. FJAT-27225]OCA90332.1 hypothetical protein A8F94_00030 [Bacillus sp. FJAT-27225]
MEKLKRLDVEQLNIVDENGTVRLRLFNNQNIPPAMMDGEDILPGHRQSDPVAGLMFYNSEGDESGGLIYGSQKDNDGNHVSYGSLTFDQYKQDQVVQVLHHEENGKKNYGFSIFDRPNTNLREDVKKDREIRNSTKSEEEKNEELNKLWAGNVRRAFMGKNEDGDVIVQLTDSKGQPRIRMVVDQNDIPRMEFLDGEGKVLYKLPPEE